MSNGDLADFFWARVDVRAADECWPWKGTVTSKGYGEASFGRRGEVQRWRAHRLSVYVDGRDLPQGLVVMHVCDNPICVNPAHLRIGTALDNARDMMSKGRFVNYKTSLTHCAQGHEFSAENTSVRSGQRRCRTCERLYRIRRARTALDAIKEDRT